MLMFEETFVAITLVWCNNDVLRYCSLASCLHSVIATRSSETFLSQPFHET